tara:strand:- start:1429 stop:2007 length:579 start_codon:yes stop_codon:yes gene_type:complete
MKNLKLLINSNNNKCFYRNYIKSLKFINVSFKDIPTRRYVSYNYKQIKNYHNYNESNTSNNNYFKNYLDNLEKLNAVIMINNECHSDPLSFELGYLLNKVPNLPIFYANNYNYNLINDDNNMVYELLCHYKNFEFYQSNNNEEICDKLCNFLYNLSEPNDENLLDMYSEHLCNENDMYDKIAYYKSKNMLKL